MNFHYLYKIWDWNCSFEEILDIISLMNGKLFFTIILYYCMNAIRIARVNSSCCLTYSIFFHSNLDHLVDIIFIITPLFMILNDACNHVICNSLLFICALSFIQQSFIQKKFHKQADYVSGRFITTSFIFFYFLLWYYNLLLQFLNTHWFNNFHCFSNPMHNLLQCNMFQESYNYLFLKNLNQFSS